MILYMVQIGQIVFQTKRKNTHSLITFTPVSFLYAFQVVDCLIYLYVYSGYIRDNPEFIFSRSLALCTRSVGTLQKSLVRDIEKQNECRQGGAGGCERVAHDSCSQKGAAGFLSRNYIIIILFYLYIRRLLK